LVQAFRDEVAAAVRTAEFADLRGLVVGLSTGVQAGLEKLQAQPAVLHQAAGVDAGRAVRLAPRPPFLAGREDLLAELGARPGEAGSVSPDHLCQGVRHDRECAQCCNGAASQQLRRSR
jgi:hypothetical protein